MAKIKIVHVSQKEKHISKEDADMDERMIQAVRSAKKKAAVCKKPIAKYDMKTKRAYLEYPSGAKRYVK